MPERDASADRAHALPVDAHQRRYGAPGRVHAQPCDLPLEVTRVRALASRHGVFCQIFVGRFGVSFSPFERLFLGRFGFGQSCGLSVIA